MPSDCSNFKDEETAAHMYAKLLRCTGYTWRAVLTKGETPGIGESQSKQPISGPLIFSKRQALSRAVVVNSNMSCGKYLAREGPGSRLASLALRSFNVDKERVRTAARKKWKNGPCAPLRVLSDDKFRSLWQTGAFWGRLGTATVVQLAFFSWIWIVTYLQKRSQVWNGVQMPS